jgi:histone H3/H4
MKKLTKNQIKKLIREAMATGLSHLQAMAAVTNEFEMYAQQIHAAAVEMLVDDMAAQK